MRPALFTLLERATLGIGRSVGPWTHVVMLHSTGAVGLRKSAEDARTVDRGFHLLILAADGSPSAYCKCRSALAGSAHLRESAVLDAFNRHSASAPIVAASRVERDDAVEILASEFIDGTRLDRALSGMDEGSRTRTLRRCLRNAASLSRIALEIGEPFGSGPASQSIADLARRSLSLLPQLGISREDCDELERALRQAGEVPRQPQHRDLWPPNVIVDRAGECRIIDLDHFGDVAVPLYDSLHLLRTTWDQLSTRIGAPWFNAILSPTEPQAMRGLLAEEIARAGLDDAQAGGCLLFYLLDFATTVRDRAGAMNFWERFAREIPAAASWLKLHGSVTQLGALMR